MNQSTKKFALCVDNKDYEASLVLWKIYRILTDPDPRTVKDGLIRIVDESGEDYLYHRSHFILVDLPASARKKIRAFQNCAVRQDTSRLR